MRVKKTTIVYAIIILGVLYFIYYRMNRTVVDTLVASEINTISINDKKLYIMAKAWGITGNHEQVILSYDPITNKKSIPDSAMTYFLIATSTIYYKKVANDSLYVYTGPCKIIKPKKEIVDGAKIKFNILRTYDENKNYEKNFTDYGLTRLSISPVDSIGHNFSN